MDYEKIDDETCKVRSTEIIERIYSVQGILAKKASLEDQLVKTDDTILGMENAGCVFPK